ncbi:OLC1v1036736C1 [Oldenlandia corymbosa var. corymbosa]|uniref:OLC1v1036736C1 n=1 Tax=Oldenlandia corymbosa var. corymbosa TaxID=529605 RepID=A0AAV1CW21_OLDCO|nr:OLC1v1036736C1 [Oldenlandia corymbosa var. corymbosa]
MEAGAKIEIISREFVKPSTPTPEEKRELKLSFLDQLQGLTFIPFLFFYQNEQPGVESKSETTTTTLRLKQSLSECLTKFYPLAGQLNPDDHHVSVKCDDSGALFIVAKLDVSLSEAVQNPSLESFAQYLTFEPLSNDVTLLGSYPKNEILLAVQITWFSCGGNAIGYLLEIINCGTRFDAGRNLFPAPEIPICPPQIDVQGKEKYVYKKLVFSKEKISELKQLAIAASSSSSSSSSSLVLKDPTRVEVISAFIWNHLINVARAKDQAVGGNDDKTMFRIWNSVNVRTRISSLNSSSSSSSSNDFPFGNFSIVAIASFTPPDEITAGNPDYYRDLGSAELEVDMQKPTMKISDRVITSWCRFPIYEVDFGWGKPVSVGPASSKAPAPGVLLFGTRCDDGIEAVLTVLEDELSLLPDKFLSLATTNFF